LKFNKKLNATQPDGETGIKICYEKMIDEC